MRWLNPNILASSWKATSCVESVGQIRKFVSQRRSCWQWIDPKLPKIVRIGMRSTPTKSIMELIQFLKYFNWYKRASCRMLLSCRDRLWHWKRKQVAMAAQPTQNRLFPQTNASMASIRTLQQALTNSSRPNVLCHRNVFSSPKISHERAFGQVVNGGSAEQNQGGFSMAKIS